jgi:hypothetical protein
MMKAREFGAGQIKPVQAVELHAVMNNAIPLECLDARDGHNAGDEAKNSPHRRAALGDYLILSEPDPVLTSLKFAGFESCSSQGRRGQKESRRCDKV